MATSDHEGAEFTSSVGAVDTAEDRRMAGRICKRVSVRLTAMGGSEGSACIAEDLSEDGLFVRVPLDCGLAVGRRVEVLFANEAGAPAPDALAGESCYATVVRTATMADETPAVVGAGLRFDQPLFF